ncbi:platelet endothelial cell adhesion molecule isoform X2 [Pristis pectinata]|uniref:platelet endothelial cell adhesion molecule isoform X2 n=1 Tax=Pristis pectinata TaxID=685728 RepID=UPI00223E6CFA|nr:platelet endothelial cell adhesion molecule isoform X2 [Pristis pectinata]
MVLTLLLSEVCNLDVCKADSQQGVTINDVQIKSDPENSAKAGSSIILTCSVNIIAPSGLASQISYFFYKGSNKDFLLKNTMSAQQSSHVTIQSARASHTGYYFCVVEVGNKMAESEPSYLTVAGELQTPRLTIHPMEVIAGNRIELHCDATEELPPLEFIFYKYKNGQYSRLRDIEKTNKSFATHSLKVAEETDLAYSCTTQGKDSKTSSNYSALVNITVQDPFSRHLFTIEPQCGIFEGDEMTINCTVLMSSLIISDIKPELTIVKGTIPIKTEAHGPLEAKLSKNATVNDTGVYRCNARWDQTFETIEQQVIVAVPVSKPILKSAASLGIVVQGDHLRLTCAVSRGSWPITYKFFKGIPGKLLHQLTVNATEANYDIPSANTTQSGKYACHASNSASKRIRTERSLYINITVKVPVSKPKIKLVTSKTTYEIGKRISLQCQSTNGTPPMTYLLFLNQRFIYSVKTSNREPVVFNVLINNTEDGGVYKCKAENEISNLSKYSEGFSVLITVPVSTPLLFPLLNSTKVNLGETVTLHCITSTGTLPINYTLYRSHSRLTAISTPKAGPAVFHVTITEHSGYTCKAENQISSQCSNRIEFHILSTTSFEWLYYTPIILLLLLLGTLLAFYIKDKNQNSERYITQKQRNQGSVKENTMIFYSKVSKMTHPRLSQTDSYALIEGTYEEKDYVNISASKGTGNGSESDGEEKYINISKQNYDTSVDSSCSNEDEVVYTQLNLASPKNENASRQEEGTVYATINLNK